MNNELTPAEIDAIIAEKVMGWKSWEGFYFKDNVECGLVSAYHPTSDVAQAFKALDRICAPDVANYHIHSGFGVKEEFWVEVTSIKWPGPLGFGNHQLLPMAACLAILDYLKAEGKI
jgi:hypothetical protein